MASSGPAIEALMREAGQVCVVLDVRQRAPVYGRGGDGGPPTGVPTDVDLVLHGEFFARGLGSANG